MEKEEAMYKGNVGYTKGFWQGYVWALAEDEKEVLSTKQYQELDQLIYNFTKSKR
ncbi:MAG: hypothetical protein ACYCS1_05145 [Gammaproteobacteria bacterium]